MKKTKMLVLTAAIVLGLGTAVEAKLPANAIVVGSNVYDVTYLTSNISKINDEIMNNLGSIFYVDGNNVTKDIFTGSTVDDAQVVNRVGNTLNYYTSSGQVQKLVADSSNQFDPNGISVGDLSAVMNITYKKITVGNQTLYAYSVKATVSGLQDAAYFSIDTSSTVPLNQVNTYIGTALAGAPKLTIYNTAQKDIASGPVTGVALTGDSGTIDVPVALHYDGTQQIQTGTGNSSVNIANTGFSAINSDNKWMYYVNTSDGNKLYKKSLSGVDDSPISDDRSGYINLMGDWVYYINYSDGSKIYKVRTDGTQKQQVSDNMASCLNILSGKIYYINHNDRARIYVIDSQGERQLCSDSASFLSAGNNNFLYYVNTLDGNKLYKYLLTNSTKSSVSDIPVQFLNVLADSSVLYTGKDGLLYGSSGAYTPTPTGLTAVTNIPSGKGATSSLKTVNDRLTVICSDDESNIYYKSYADGGKLYKLDKKTGNGYKVVDDSVDYANIIGDYIYYMKAGKLYYVPKDSDGTVKGTAVIKPKSTLKISKLGTIDPIRTDDINKISFPDRVAATMSDNSIVQLVVNWNKTIPKPSKGLYTFSGTVLGYGNKVSLNVTLDSGVIDTTNVSVVNGVGSKDTVTVSKLNQGDIINVYTGYTDTKPVKSAVAGGNGIAAITGLNLNPNGDFVYITITKQGKAEGQKSACSYGPEAPASFAVNATSGTITGLKSGMSYKVFLEIPNSTTGSLPDTPDPTKQVGGASNVIKAGSDGSISVPQLETMTDLEQLRIVATNGTDSTPSAAMEVGKPKLDGVSVDLSNGRLLGTTADMLYSYDNSDWTNHCLAISTPLSMTRSLQVYVKSQAKGPYLESNVSSFGLFPTPVITGITDGGVYSIGSDLTIGWPAKVSDANNGTIIYNAVLYNLTDDPNRNSKLLNTTDSVYSSDLIKADGSGIIKPSVITGAGKSYELVVTATKTIGSQTGQSTTTIHFSVTAGKPQTIDITIANDPGTMKPVPGKTPLTATTASDWTKVNPTTDALTYYNATPRWTDYPSTSSTAVIQRVPLESNRDLSKVYLDGTDGVKAKDWNSAAKVSFAPNTPVTQDGYYKLTVTSKADDNKATTDTIKYFIVDTGRDAILPAIAGVSDNGTYSSGITSGITITEDTSKKESITIPTLTRDGYVTPLVDNSGKVINPTMPGSAAITSGAITLKGSYQLDLNTINVINGKKSHKGYNFYVDNTTSISDDVKDVGAVSSGDTTVVVGSSTNPIPYGATIKVYSASGNVIGSIINLGTTGIVTVPITGGVPNTDTSIYVTSTEKGKQESNKFQVSVGLVPVIKTVAPTTLTETAANDGTVSGNISGTDTNTIVIELQNGTLADTTSADTAIDSTTYVTASKLPSGLHYAITKIDSTRLGITITGKATNNNKSDNVSDVTFTIDKSKVTGATQNLTTGNISINFNTATDAVSNLKTFDIGNNNNATDLQVTFDKVTDETKVKAYRVIVAKSGSTLNFAAANALASGRYKEVTPTGSNLTVTLDSSTTDSDGDAIVNSTPYNVYVLSVADGYYTNVNALSSAATITLNSAAIPVSNFTNTVKDDTTATFTWTAPTGATAVKLQQKLSTDATWTDSTTTATVGNTASTATVTGLTKSTAYDFRLVVTGGLNAGNSNVANVTTTTPVSNFGNAAKDSSTATFTWTAPTGSTAMKIQYSLQGQNTWVDVPVTNGVNTAKVTGLNAATSYDFRLVVTGGANAGTSNVINTTTN